MTSVCYFAPRIINKVFEHVGNLANIKVAHNLMRLIAEGFSEDDETGQLRSCVVRISIIALICI